MLFGLDDLRVDWFASKDVWRLRTGFDLEACLVQF